MLLPQILAFSVLYALQQLRKANDRLNVRTKTKQAVILAAGLAVVLIGAVVLAGR